MSWLINTTQLEKFRKSQKNLLIFDASFHLDNRNAKQEFAEKHIIDAQFFDIDLFSDPNTDIPHMLLSDEKLISEKCGSLGIRNDYKIIFYDNSDLHSACRALWMFKMFGHNSNQLYILDGGLKAWEKSGGKVESGEPVITPRSYNANFQPQHLCTLSQMKEHCHNNKTQIIDVRHPVRYCGGPESRPGLRSGHIPGSISLPYFVLFEKDGTFLPLEKIRKKMLELNIDLNAPIAATCGSAITATILDFVLDLMGHVNHTVYDGSWCEWGADKLYPGEQSINERPAITSVIS